MITIIPTCKSVYSSLILAVALIAFVHHGAAMDSPDNEFGARDLVSLGVFTSDSTPVSTTSKGGRTKSRLFSSTKQEALVVATAKKGDGSSHPSIPYIQVDVSASQGSCGPFDWIFIPTCRPPQVDVKLVHVNKGRLQASYVYTYRLPSGWGNLRITLPNLGSCGRDGGHPRSASMRMATPSSLCMQAHFRREECKRRFPFFRKRCSLRGCEESMTLLARLVTFDGSDITTMPYVASGNGIDSCSSGSIRNLFLK